MSDIDTAIALACRVHTGQKDKAGQSYILHPLRLMLRLQADEERIVAVLHDVIEDGDISFEELGKMGFSETVIEAVDCLSRRKDETYDEFIKRLSLNRLAVKVKIEDIRDNMDLSRLESVDEDDLRRVRKYHRALKQLSKIA